MEQPARYHVVFYGELTEGQQAEEVKHKLVGMFRLSPERIEAVFSGKPLVIKEDVGRNEALKYKAAFEKSGAACRIVPVKRKTAQTSPAAPQKIQKPKTSTRPGRQNVQGLFFRSEIPQDRLENAVQSYARAFRQGEEQALLLLDLGPSAAALLLSDRRLYVRKVNAPPRTFKLTSIRAVDSKQNSLLINRQPVLVLPKVLQHEIPAVLEAINHAVQEAALHPIEEKPLAPQVEEEPAQESRGGNVVKIAVVAVLVILVLGVGFQVFWPSTPKDGQPPAQVSTETDEEKTSFEKPHATSETASTKAPPAQPASCQSYEYTIEAGQSANLEFIQEYYLPGKELKLEEAASIYDLENDELQQYGGYAGMTGPYITTIQVGVWAVDGSAMYSTLRNIDWCQYIDEEKRWNERPPCIPKTHKWSDFTIEWQTNGYGIITRFDQVFGTMNVAKLSAEEIAAKFSASGLTPSISYGVGDVNYLRNGGIRTESEVNLSVLHRPVVSMAETFNLNITRHDRDVHLQNFPVTISAPSSTELNGGHVTKYLKFLPSNGEGPELKLHIKIAASGSIKVYGPKMTEKCF